MLGILTGLATEAAIAHKLAPQALVRCSAANADRATYVLQELLAAGATRLLSFGIAGGLAPNLPAGSSVLATHINTPDGQWHCDPAWAEAWQAQLPHAKRGGIWAGNSMIATQAEKSWLYAATGCLVAEMEAQHVAQAATAAGLPFLALRVVCDPAAYSLPAAALLPLRPNGSPNLPAILASLARQPAQLPTLLTLSGYHRAAMQALAACRLPAC
jgi:adenosylhomocysteine nucleosidase